jgi:WD40 repeat protein
VKTSAEHSSLRPRWQAELDEPAVALDVLGRDEDAALAVGGSEGTVRAIDAGGAVRWERDLDDALLTIAASPDGTRIAALGMTNRRIWNAEGDLLATSNAGWSAAAAWDARSAHLAVADGKQVRVLDRNGEIRWSCDPLASTVTGVLWPRGTLRVAASAYQGVTIFEPDTDRITQTLRAPGAISGLASAPNGRWVVGGSQDATLHGWKVNDGSDFRMSGFPATVSQLSFEETGRWMACASDDVITCWDFSGAGPTGRAAVVLTGHDATITASAWLPGDRRALISGDEDGTLLLWRITPGTRAGDELRPAGRIPDDDPITALATGPGSHTTGPIAYVARRSGRIDTLAVN